MRWERVILLVFFGNYLINEVAAGLSGLVPLTQEGTGWGPYIVFALLAAVVSALVAWWYFASARGASLKAGAIFGLTGALVSIATTFVSGIFGTMFDTGSIAAVFEVLPNFIPYLWDVSTLVLIGYWVVPAALIGWYMERSTPRAAV